MNANRNEVSREEIAHRAYEIWQSRGCPASDGTEDWQTAEAQLLAERIGRNGSMQDRARTWWSRVKEKVGRKER